MDSLREPGAASAATAGGEQAQSAPAASAGGEQAGDQLTEIEEEVPDVADWSPPQESDVVSVDSSASAPREQAKTAPRSVFDLGSSEGIEGAVPKKKPRVSWKATNEHLRDAQAERANESAFEARCDVMNAEQVEVEDAKSKDMVKALAPAVPLAEPVQSEWQLMKKLRNLLFIRIDVYPN